MPRPAHPAHHFVENQQHAIAVADLTDTLEIARHGRHAAKARTRYRLAEVRRAILRSLGQDRRFQFIGRTLAILLSALLGPAMTIFIAGCDMTDRLQHRLIGLAPVDVTAQREGAERIAVITALAGNEKPALRLANFQEILPSQLERRFNSFGTPPDKKNLIDPGRRPADQKFRPPLNRPRGGEERTG